MITEFLIIPDSVQDFPVNTTFVIVISTGAVLGIAIGFLVEHL
ncbi:MAG: hypothetical protein PV345_05345 [Wolbachia sp.]|nr:hypothetical protein [Wolbachia sp.]